VFSPSIGGMETMMEILAEEFKARGHQVKVATQVATKSERNYDYEVVRLPPLKSCVQSARLSADNARRYAISYYSPRDIQFIHPFHHRARVEEDGDSVQQQYMLQPSGTVTPSGAVGRDSQYLSRRSF
jgi:hypothetical protein